VTGEAVSRPAVRGLLLYGSMIAFTIGGFLVVRWMGRDLAPPAGAAVARAAVGSDSGQMLLHVLLALAVIIAAARLCGAAFRFLHQPPVIGEVLAGIALGPSLLGQLAPGLASYVLPPSVAPQLSVLAQVGVVLYMFLVGIELDLTALGRKAHAAVVVSHASIIVPFLLGAILALQLFPLLAPANVSFTNFALFLGVSMSVTAFPVLARILTDRRMHTTPLGVVALTCAAVDDVTAWCLLALLVAVTKAEPMSAVVTLVLSLVYIAVMISVARPALGRWVRARDDQGLTRSVMSVACVALLLSALVTEYIGIHAIFGAFMLGAMVPSGSRIARELLNRLEDIVVILFLPAFFAFTGMRTQIGLVTGAQAWVLCGLIILVATAGKFGGSMAAARLTGMSWRDAASLGILMNTRGLMELIVLNLGLDLGVISPTLFAMLVIMALVTTFATTPILHALRPERAPELAMAVAPSA
jgi:Kef-type K+ transport system membrane component KefB